MAASNRHGVRDPLLRPAARGDSFDLGYDKLSAVVAMFRRRHGAAPARVLESRSHDL